MLTITYAGRLRDTRKGLDLFFDALEFVWAARPHASMRIWIIGGSPDEVEFAQQSAMARPRMHGGAMTFWGRIEHDALPEFYSRSSLLIVPSFREQFGMVAAEAMMCGTPVIAARVGGLQDVVVAGHTGMLFDAGNAAALAACILSYLNVPDLARWHGANAQQWAQENYASARVLPLMEAALDPAAIGPSGDPALPSQDAFISRSIDALGAIAQRILGRPVRFCGNLTSSHSLSFRVDLDGGSVFGKQYSRRPSSIHTLHGERSEPRQTDPAVHKLSLMSRLSNLPYVPALIARDDATGIILQQWVDAAPAMPFTDTRDVLTQLQKEIAATDLLPTDVLDTFVDSTGCLADRDVTRTTVAGFDRLAAQLHAPLHGGIVACRRMHPQIELFRIAEFLEENRSFLPQHYTVRALAEARRLLLAQPFIAARPVLAHGSLKAEHIMGGPERYFLCDFDQTGYYVGPLDTVHWLWDYLERQNAAPEMTLVSVLRHALTDPQDRYLSACWLLALLLNKDLVYVMRGEWSRLDTSMRMLWTFSDTVRGLCSFG